MNDQQAKKTINQRVNQLIDSVLFYRYFRAAIRSDLFTRHTLRRTVKEKTSKEGEVENRANTSLPLTKSARISWRGVRRTRSDALSGARTRPAADVNGVGAVKNDPDFLVDAAIERLITASPTASNLTRACVFIAASPTSADATRNRRLARESSPRDVRAPLSSSRRHIRKSSAGAACSRRARCFERTVISQPAERAAKTKYRRCFENIRERAIRTAIDRTLAKRVVDEKRA